MTKAKDVQKRRKVLQAQIEKAERELELLSLAESPIRIYENDRGPQVFAYSSKTSKVTYLGSFSYKKYGEKGAQFLAGKLKDACERLLEFVSEYPEEVFSFVETARALEPVLEPGGDGAANAMFTPIPA